MSSPKHIHLIAVCGTGMSALAGLLKQQGHALTGSDARIFPPISTLLKRIGIACQNGYDASHIPPDTDIVIVGNAVRSDNPEVVAARERNLPYFSMPQALATFFLKGKRSLVVAGTHGKTTTSSLLASVLTSAGRDPGMMVGGWVKDFDGNHRLGRGEAFVVEGDEYDTAFFDKGPKFLHYRPDCAIVTSIEHDHADIYPTFFSLKEAFRAFIQKIPQNGLLVAAAGDLSLTEATQEACCRVESYSLTHPADWQATDIRDTEGVTSFSVQYRGRAFGRMQTCLMGLHNVKNALAVTALSAAQGLSYMEIQTGLAKFQGVKRRQEVISSKKDILVIDDFAHHPTAILATLNALRYRYSKRRLFAVFEPRSASSRRNIFQDAFTEAFGAADVAVLAEVFSPESVPVENRLNPQRIVANLTALGKRAFYGQSAEKIVEILMEHLQPGDMVCIMSSGDFGGIYEKLTTAINDG